MNFQKSSLRTRRNSKGGGGIDRHGNDKYKKVYERKKKGNKVSMVDHDVGVKTLITN